jgi:hypothetical protein
MHALRFLADIFFSAPNNIGAHDVKSFLAEGQARDTVFLTPAPPVPGFFKDNRSLHTSYYHKQGHATPC